MMVYVDLFIGRSHSGKAIPTSPHAPVARIIRSVISRSRCTHVAIENPAQHGCHNSNLLD